MSTKCLFKGGGGFDFSSQKHGFKEVNYKHGTHLCDTRFPNSIQVNNKQAKY